MKTDRFGLGSSVYRHDHPVFGCEYRKRLHPTKSTKLLREAQNVEASIFSSIPDNPVFSYRRRDGENGTKARCVLSMWRREGIPVPHVRQPEADEIATAAVPGESMSQAIHSTTRSESLESLVDTVTAIWSVAKEKENKHLLHLDMKLDNFLYDPEGNTAYTIDPGIEMKPVG